MSNQLTNTPEDRWEAIQDSLRSWFRLHSKFRGEITRFSNRMNTLKGIFYHKLIKYKQTKKEYHYVQAMEVLNQAEAEFKRFSKYEIIASMSGN